MREVIVRSQRCASISPWLAQCFLLLASTQLMAQESDLGRVIYADCAKSVFMLYAQGPSGDYVAQGSGFWVPGHKMITNAHVANAGKMFVDVGSARLPAKIESVDAFNDLAVLRLDFEITAKPLILADFAPTPGEKIFAIGNPRGLERSISEGVISATREVENRQLLQVTAPISHGSSGGPIVNTKGQVVGVAVGFLDSGQSLNFAVPVAKVIALLRTGTPKLDLGVFDQIESLRTQHQSEQFSADPDSDWQKTNEQIKTLLRKAFDGAGTNDSALLRIAKVANDDWDTDLAVSTAERLIAVKPSSEAHTVLAEALNHKYMFAEDSAEKQRLMAQAEKEARVAVSTVHTPSAESYSVLANVLEDRGSYQEAKTNFNLARESAKRTEASDLALASARGLVRCADALQEFDEAGRLLEGLKIDGESKAWDWSSHADRLASHGLYQRAGDSYLSASQLDGPYTDWCSAAAMYSISAQQDLVLSCARQCIEKGTGVKNSEKALGPPTGRLRMCWTKGEFMSRRSITRRKLQCSTPSTSLPMTTWQTH